MTLMVSKFALVHVVPGQHSSVEPGVQMLAKQVSWRVTRSIGSGSATTAAVLVISMAKMVNLKNAGRLDCILQ